MIAIRRNIHMDEASHKHDVCAIGKAKNMRFAKGGGCPTHFAVGHLSKIEENLGALDLPGLLNPTKRETCVLPDIKARI